MPMSIKLLPNYTFLENILIEGKARNKQRPVNEKKSSYTSLLFPEPSCSKLTALFDISSQQNVQF